MDIFISEAFKIQLNTNKENALQMARKCKTFIHILKESKGALRIKNTLLLDFTLLCTGPTNHLSHSLYNFAQLYLPLPPPWFLAWVILPF
jgi:hypothetical protein